MSYVGTEIFGRLSFAKRAADMIDEQKTGVSKMESTGFRIASVCVWRQEGCDAFCPVLFRLSRLVDSTVASFRIYSERNKIPLSIMLCLRFLPIAIKGID